MIPEMEYMRVCHTEHGIKSQDVSRVGTLVFRDCVSRIAIDECIDIAKMRKKRQIHFHMNNKGCYVILIIGLSNRTCRKFNLRRLKLITEQTSVGQKKTVRVCNIIYLKNESKRWCGIRILLWRHPWSHLEAKMKVQSNDRYHCTSVVLGGNAFHIWELTTWKNPVSKMVV